MLDLNKLEQKLDAALSKETAESLASWLLEKRSKSFLLQLGNGQIETIKSQFIEEFTITHANISIETKEEFSQQPTNNAYLMAA